MKIYTYSFEGHTIEVARIHIGTAYARNGNTHNPTEYYQWSATLNGECIIGAATTRAIAYEYCRAKALGIPYAHDQGVYANGEGAARRYVNVRPWTVVKAEMQANYQSRHDSEPETENT